MLDTLLPYFERELSALRELSGEFAGRYPKIAARLQLEAGQCADPHTERLIQSFAFLAARIHKKLDDDYPEIAASLLDLVQPHFQQPIPSTTLVQLQIDEARPTITRRHRIERHQEVLAPAVGGVQCRFRTCYPVDMLPLALVSCRLERVSGGTHLHRLALDAAAVLTLELRTLGGLAVQAVDLQSLRFFLDGDPALMHLLHELLLTRTLRVEVSDGSDNPAQSRTLPPRAVAPVGFESDEAMLDDDGRSFPAYRLLAEYFTCPEKFLFVDLRDLGPAVAHLGGPRLVLRFMLSRFPDAERHHRLMAELKPAHFKLFCTPVINLFSARSEPIRLTHHQSDYPVWVDARKKHAHEVIAIRRVTRVEKSGADETVEVIPPFYGLHHGVEPPARFYWHATREASHARDDAGTDLCLQLVDLNFTTLRGGVEVLALDLLCSNRDLPAQLPFGGGTQADRIDFSLAGHSIVKRVRLLRKPTATQRLPAKRGLQWRLISHLSLNYLSIIREGREALLEMLSLYNRSDSPANLRQIQGITDITSKRAVTRVSGKDFSGFVRGTEIHLTLNEDAFVGSSAYLFASVLERFFALYCTPNSFTRLIVTFPQRPEETLQWPPRTGTASVT